MVPLNELSDHYFKPCDYPGGEDKCMPCPQNTLTKYAIDTSSYKQGNSSDICKSCTDFCVNKTESEYNKDLNFWNILYHILLLTLMTNILLLISWLFSPKNKEIFNQYL